MNQLGEYAKGKQALEEWRAVDPVGAAVIEKILNDALESAKANDLEKMLSAYGKLEELMYTLESVTR